MAKPKPLARAAIAAALLAVGSATAAQQPSPPVPQPFPQPSPSQPSTPPPAQQPPPATVSPASPAPDEPTEATLGLPIYPNSQFLASYDAGRGQRYYLFGTETSFSVLVAYYRNVLRTRGSLVFDAPATHMFEVGRFREDSMAFPPGVTVKDYTWGGSAGYLNPKRGAQPERFPTVVQIVPSPPDQAR